ncbi:MAG TPA: zf-HC2 domain-containing protein, partial [Blastocatellia bacterium]|nr:zf-HC2 domain-containing protein [Blastocatellia bacterium]
MFWKTDDRAIDKLLGAQRARQGDPAQVCREFDPDLANAYIEHSLTTTETLRYEQHLSACTQCRKSVVMLSRMAVADPVFSQTEVKSFALAGETRTGIKRWFGVMSAPQWAMAATAVLVLAISLPFLMSNKRNSANLQATSGQSDSAVASDRLQSESDSLEAHASGNAAANASTQPGQQPGSNAQAKIEREQESPDKNLLAIAKEPVAESPATGAGTETTAPAPQPPQPAETKADSTPADQTVAKAEQTPPASRQEEPQLP